MVGVGERSLRGGGGGTTFDTMHIEEIDKLIDMITICFIAILVVHVAKRPSHAVLLPDQRTVSRAYLAWFTDLHSELNFGRFWHFRANKGV